MVEHNSKYQHLVRISSILHALPMHHEGLASPVNFGYFLFLHPTDRFIEEYTSFDVKRGLWKENNQENLFWHMIEPEGLRLQAPWEIPLPLRYLSTKKEEERESERQRKNEEIY